MDKVFTSRFRASPTEPIIQNNTSHFFQINFASCVAVYVIYSKNGPDVPGKELHVDLQGRVKHVHLGQHAGQVAHLGAPVLLEVLVVIQELLHGLLLIDLQEGLGLPLSPAPLVV